MVSQGWVRYSLEKRRNKCEIYNQEKDNVAMHDCTFPRFICNSSIPHIQALT